MKEYRENCW